MNTPRLCRDAVVISWLFVKLSAVGSSKYEVVNQMVAPMFCEMAIAVRY